MYIKRSILSACVCVWERKLASVLRTPASACALKFLWILNMSGSNKAKEKEKKIVLIPLVMNVTIPDTHGSYIGVNWSWMNLWQLGLRDDLMIARKKI